MKNINIEETNYELIENYKDAFDEALVREKYTDYFKEYDYIVGDIAYGKLRLKGFYDKGNKNQNKINDYTNVKDYIKHSCAFDCKYFILKKESGKEE